MRTALDAPPEALDDAEKSFVSKIREHGWFRTGVFGDDEGPGFSYTSGFWVSASQPEIIMFSMKDAIAHDVFWDLFWEAKDGKNLPVGKKTSVVFANLPAYVFSVARERYSNFLGWNRWFYAGDDFPCLQIVWPDREGVFPWEPNFDLNFAKDQPDLIEHGWVNEITD